MNFMKRFFSKVPLSRIHPCLREELNEVFMQMAKGNDNTKLTPLFIVKEHPHVEQHFKHYDEFKKFLEKEATDIHLKFASDLKKLEAKHTEYHSLMWGAVEVYMQDKGLWPRNYQKGKDNESLVHQEGVLYHAKRETK